jgi:hypothetical protein
LNASLRLFCFCAESVTTPGSGSLFSHRRRVSACVELIGMPSSAHMA